MTTYQDISVITNNSYRFAELIREGFYTNTLYYEFHEVIDLQQIDGYLEGLETFSERSSDFHKIFLSSDIIDEDPAIIHIAIKLADEWFIAHECGANYYNGYGPSGILKLREACTIKNVVAFASKDSFAEWIKEKFGNKNQNVINKKNIEYLQFKKIINVIQYLAVDMQRRPEEFQGLKEENIRDRILTPLNAALNGRGNGEAKNYKGKTDILFRTKDGLNEHIFELKIWKGINTLRDTIEQLKGYLSWHNNHSGIIILCYNLGFTTILNQAVAYLAEHFGFDKKEERSENEFRFKLTQSNDKYRKIETYLIFINLKTT